MAEPLFDCTHTDRQYYSERLRDFLPDRIFDIHTHVYRATDIIDEPNPEERRVMWPSLVAAENPWDHQRESYQLMFPDKEVSALIFGTITEPEGLDGMNAYTAAAARETGWPALIFARPAWSSEVLESKLIEGGFRGAKVYLSFAPDEIPAGDIRIFDFIPHHQLEVLDRLGLILLLHIPRKDRLRDPENLKQMVEIEERYPNLRVVIAHVGRAYCREDVGNAFEVISEKTRRMCFDISANTNASVFEGLIEAVGPKRILFGSDLPVARMRMRRVCEDGVYVNVIPRGLYGDVTGDVHMREVDPPEADELSFFMYEIIDAFRRAAEATGLTRGDIEDVFRNNAQRLLAT